MVIDLLSDMRVEGVIKELVEGFVINVRADTVIITFSGVYVDVSIGVVSNIGADVNANVLEAAMTALLFAMPSLCEESMPFCGATFRC